MRSTGVRLTIVAIIVVTVILTGFGATRSALAPAAARQAAPPSLVIVGDSVILGARTSLTEHFSATHAFVFDAAESRSTLAGANVVARHTASGVDVLVVALGYNDSRNPEIFRERASAVLESANADHIIWLTMRRDPRNRFDYTGANQVLRDLAGSDERLTIADWDTRSQGSGLTFDGLHLTGAGRTAMTELVDEAVASLEVDPTAVCRPATNPAPAPDSASATGYWLLGDDGTIHTVGDAPHHGDLVTAGASSFPTSMQATPSGLGYWIVDDNGEVHAFGDASFAGDMRDVALDGPIRRLEARPTGGGYWLVASDGGVFAFGAHFHGSTGGRELNAPVISLSSTTTGNGYWLVASDGGVFSFGDAVFRGSTGSLRLDAPVIDMAVRADGTYWLYASDGGVFSFGAPFLGSLPGVGLCHLPTTVAMRPTPSGIGYWLAADDGRVFAFGDAAVLGGIDLPAGRRIIDMAVPAP